MDIVRVLSPPAATCSSMYFVFEGSTATRILRTPTF